MNANKDSLTSQWHFIYHLACDIVIQTYKNTPHFQHQEIIAHENSHENISLGFQENTKSLCVWFW